MTLEEILKMPTDTVKKLKELMNELRDSLLYLEKGSDAYNEAQKKLQADLELLDNVMKASKKTVEALSGSYDALSAEMSKLKKEFKATNDEAKRKELAALINGINDKLKEMDASVGVFSRNVGNYLSAFEALGNSGAGAVIKGVKGIKGAFDVLKAHPIIAIVAAAVTVLMKIVNAFKKNEEAMNNLKKAMAPLKGIIDGVTYAFDMLVEGFSKGLVWIGEGINKMLDFLNIGKEVRLLEIDIAAQEKNNAEQNRDFIKENAKLEMEVAELRAKAADKANQSAKDRIKYITEAGEKQKLIAANNLKQAEDELALLKMQADTGVNDAEMNNKLAEAEAKVYRVQKDYNATLKETNAQISEVTNTIRASEKAASDAIKKRILDTNKATKELEDSYNSIIISMLDDDRDKFLALQEAARLKDLAKYKEYLDKKLITQEQYNEYVKKYDEAQFIESLKWESEYANKQLTYLNLLKTLYSTDANNKIAAEKDKWTKVFTELEKAHKTGLISEEEYQKQLIQLLEKSAAQIADVTKQAKTDELIKNITEQYNISIQNHIKDDLFKGLSETIQSTGNQILTSFISREISEEDTILLLKGLGIDEEAIKKKLDEIKEDIIVEGISSAMYLLADVADSLGSSFGSVFNAFGNVIDNIGVALKNSEGGWKSWGAVAGSAIAAVGQMLTVLAEQQDTQTQEGFEQQKKLQIAAATMNTLSGVIMAWTSALSLPAPASYILGAIQSAATLAMGIAQIDKIKKATFSSNNRAAATIPSVNNAAVSSIAAPVQYTSDIQGSNIEDSIRNLRVYVVESDITQTQKHVSVIENEAIF